MFHKYHLFIIEPIASFHEIQKITKMSFNIPSRQILLYIYIQCTNVYKQLICFASSKFVEQFCKE